MRRFSSYGPVNSDEHFCVERKELVASSVEQLVGNPDRGGHFFTIWAPRQTGKTWLMHRAVEEIKARHGERFVIGSLSMQGLKGQKDAEARFFRALPRLLREGFRMNIPAVRDWEDWMRLFQKEVGIFDRPLLLLIDEFDSLDSELIDQLVGLFRQMYLAREAYWLHGLALAGVRAVLGVESDQGSPFNIQRSLHVSNLIEGEVNEMFDQYEEEAGQVVAPEVRGQVFEVTRGQPGLVSWFGELLTVKYNPGQGRAIGGETWKRTYLRACHAEFNNTILNLIKKARSRYPERVVSLFSQGDVSFSIDEDWCSYLYLNGIIDYEGGDLVEDEDSLVCRFSSPFVQRRLYSAFTNELYGGRGPLLALEPGDLLEDVFTSQGLNLAALLTRYQRYLERLAARSIDPWKGHPRRKTDLQLPEAIGHFHLYAWLREAIGHRSVISPEFPTGNGKVDLVVRHENFLGVIEVKSFRDSYELRQSYGQTARYARGLGLGTATLVVFVPIHDETVLNQISGKKREGGVDIDIVAIGWG